MKPRKFGLSCLICGTLLAGTPTAPANAVVQRGTILENIVLLNYLLATGITLRTTDARKIQMLGIYSSLGDAFYAIYFLDLKNKLAIKYAGDSDEGPIHFLNYQGTGRAYELHKQFNGKWDEDIPGLGDDSDIWNRKLGFMEGPRAGVRLKQADFVIQAAPQLTGSYIHTRCSEDFGIDPAALSGYAPGRFTQIISSRVKLKLDVPLTDRVNAAGGTYPVAVAEVEDYLINTRRLTLSFAGELPQFVE